MRGFNHEDGPEDTGAHEGGVTPSGHNGSFRLYVHDEHKGMPAPGHIREQLAQIRLRCAVQAAGRPR